MNEPEKITLEQIDAKLAQRDELETDDEALLWCIRAERMGSVATTVYLQMVMGVGEQEADDILARLSERGFVERA